MAYIFFSEMNLNRALHCNQMIIHIEREREQERTHIRIQEREREDIGDHENGGIRE